METTFSNFQEEFLLISPELQWLCSAYKTSHIKPSKYDSTFGINYVRKKKVGRGWGCGSEQAPLTHNEGHTLGYFAMYMY